MIFPEFGFRSCTFPAITSFTAASDTGGGFIKRMTGYRKEPNEAMTPPPSNHDSSVLLLSRGGPATFAVAFGQCSQCPGEGSTDCIDGILSSYHSRSSGNLNATIPRRSNPVNPL